MDSPTGPAGDPSVPSPRDAPAAPPAQHDLAHGLVADRPRTAAAMRLLTAAEGSTALDRLSRLAASLLGMPSAQVSLLTTVQSVAGGTGAADEAVGTDGPLESSICTVTTALGGPLAVADARADARVAALPPVASGAVGAYLGVPLVTAGGEAIGALCVYGPEPRRWTEEEVDSLEQLAGAVMAELELSALAADYEASRLRWDVAIDAAGIGSFDWDLRSDRVDWDERLQGLFGYAPGEFVPHITEAFSRVHPDDRPVLDAELAGAIESCGTFHAEYRIVVPSGPERWVAARGQAFPGPDGTAARLLGTAHDITEARGGQERAAQLLESMATGFVSVDRDWRVTYLNAMGGQVVGYTAAELVGRSVWEAFPGLRDSDFGVRYEHAMATGETVEIEAYYEHLAAWLAVRVVPSDDGLALYFLDITDRHADQERAEASAARMGLLASVSEALAAAGLDAEAAVARLGQLVVPVLADWSVVTLIDDGSVRDLGWWHVTEELRPVVETYARNRLSDDDGHGPVWTALRTREPVLLADRAMARTIPQLGAAPAIAALTRLAPESVVVLPLVTKGRVMGVLSLCRGSDRPPFSDEEVATAGEIAGRASLALDNARLYAQQRSLAEGLQRSLLTAPPEPDHCEIVVRYVPAVEAASVGGDWFDSFLQADGATTLVIGDVVGHDTEAAAAMGQVRGLLRGIAWHSGDGPAAVLTGVDAAMQGLQLDTTATAVVARLEQTPDEVERGVTRLRWSNAGHPPPMVVSSDGTVVPLTAVHADLLLGIDPTTPRAEREVALDRDSTVLLYTDGLVERRGQDVDTGLERLRGLLAELHGLSLDDLCDELLARLQQGADDDIALIAVRLHRQDRPRPAEAGPQRVPENVDPPSAPTGAEGD